MPLPQKRIIPGLLLLLVVVSLAAPPLWWSADDTRVIDVNAIGNNFAPANVGQAKHMVSSALDALYQKDPSLALLIRDDLTSGGNAVVDLQIPNPKSPEWKKEQSAQLVIGQLKALADPFYRRLNAAYPTWLEAERTATGNNHSGSIFPWTADASDDRNKAVANIGQLKAVFSLHFETLPAPAFVDVDLDTLDDNWEYLQFGDLNRTADADTDGDSVSNEAEFASGTNPLENLDSNNDGLPDDWVTWQLSLPNGVAVSSLPPNEDPDGDELTTILEFQRGTWPRHFDSDGDEQSDWQELAQQTDPLDPNSKGSPITVSGYRETTNLDVPSSLINPVDGASYDLKVFADVPLIEGLELTSSNDAGGPAYEWIDISAEGEYLTQFDANAYDIVQRAIPFDFGFYGETYSEVFISGQGFLTFTHPDPNGFSPGFPKDHRTSLPNPSGHRPLISPYQQFMEPDVRGAVYFKAFADHVVIQWEQVKLYGFEVDVSFQAVLYADGSIRFNYESIPLTPDGFWVGGYLAGIQNAAGDDGIGVSWSDGGQQGIPIHTSTPISLRFGSPETEVIWVTSSENIVSGPELSWDMTFIGSSLPQGEHTALLKINKAGGEVIYSRPIRFMILPPVNTPEDDVINGTAGDDAIDGLAGNDVLTGLEGNDSLLGGAGDDILIGGRGDDTLIGGIGKDSYQYNLGDGNDLIDDNAAVHQADDLTADYSEVHFGPGILPGMIRATFIPDDVNNQPGKMKFEIQGPIGGSVSVANWNETSGSTQLKTPHRFRFYFEDGTIWKGELLWGNDIFSVGFGGFTGGVNNDNIIGTADNDDFRGLEGDDYLAGGDGWDSYYYRWGDGNDIIAETGEYTEPSVVYIFGASLLDQITYDFVPPKHLRINISNPSDPSKDGSVTLRDWYIHTPTLFKESWRVHVEDATGAWVRLNTFMRSMGTNGPDFIQTIYLQNRQDFDAGDGDDTIYGSFYSETINAGNGNDLVYGGVTNLIRGGAGNDKLLGETDMVQLYGDEGDDILYGGNEAYLDGGAGNDRIDTYGDQNIIIGGPGDDELRGGSGIDIYHWNLGDGDDVIEESTTQHFGGLNKLVFGPGILRSDIRYEIGASNELKFIIEDAQGNPNGSVTINGWYAVSANSFGPTPDNGNHAILWKIEFTDNSEDSWFGRDEATLGPDNLVVSSVNGSISGGLGNDTLRGLDDDDTLFGDEGDDRLIGNYGNDRLEGGDGSDTLEGGGGDDVLIGGKGIDFVGGSHGSDHYYWHVGDGNDVYEDNGAFLDDLDVIHFSGEVAPGVEISRFLVTFRPYGFDSGLFQVLNPDGEILAEITVRNWGSSKGRWLLQFPGETEPSGWQNLSYLGTAADDVITAGSYSDTMNGHDGNDTLDGGPGNDTIYGDDGNDYLIGGEGADNLLGGLGADEIEGGSSDDRLDGGEGDDILRGDSGRDVLMGGPGNDQLFGGSGEDQYIWFPGDGHDVIDDTSTLYSIGNRLVLAQGVNPNDIRIVPLGQDIRFEILDSEAAVVGSVTIKKWYDPALRSLEWFIEFSDGSVWEKTRLSTSGDDYFVANQFDTLVEGLLGNDTLVGIGNGNVLVGGEGDDYLIGGYTPTTYVYQSGDGNDTIQCRRHSTFGSTSRDVLDLTSFNVADVNLEVVPDGEGDIEINLTFSQSGETITILKGQYVIIEFGDEILEYNSQGNNVHGDASEVTNSGWHDSDEDGLPDDVEIALSAFDPTLADSADAGISPVESAVVDPSILVKTGNRYGSISEALAAVEETRNGKPWVVIKLMPGIYREDLDINATGVLFKGPGEEGRAILVHSDPGSPLSIVGRSLIFDGICFGDGIRALNVDIAATESLKGIRFTNCLFKDQRVIFDQEAGSKISISSGKADFIHCSFLNIYDLSISSLSITKAVNSLFKFRESSTWTGNSRLRQISCLPDPIETHATAGDLQVRSDGLLKVTYPGATSPAMNQVPFGLTLIGWKDIDGDPRDASPDIGCDEYLDTEDLGDHLQDSWEKTWFGNTASQGSGGDPDGDGKSNLEEYDLESNPLDPNSKDSKPTEVNLLSTDLYKSSSLIGPIPQANSSGWKLDNDGSIILLGRQGTLEYRFSIAEPTIAALFLNISFQKESGGEHQDGRIRISLDGEFLQDLTYPWGEKLVPLHLVGRGEHIIKIEFINSLRGSYPKIHSIRVSSMKDLEQMDLMRDLVFDLTNQVVVWPAQSLVSPAFAEGRSNHRSAIEIGLKRTGVGIPLNRGPDNMWYADVPLEPSDQATAVNVSFEGDFKSEIRTIHWMPTVLEDHSNLKIRKGDSLRLNVLGAGLSPQDLVEYQVDSLPIGSASLNEPLAHRFDQAGTFVITAKSGGVTIAGAETTVSVVEADFEGQIVTAQNVSSSWPLPGIPEDLNFQPDTRLRAFRQTDGSLSMSPSHLGKYPMLARIGKRGPVVAATDVAVLSVSNPGLNGGGRVASLLPDGRKVINMTYTLSGEIPPNLLIRIQLHAAAATFLDGSKVAWLTAADFDEFGVANLQAFTTGPICQGFTLYLSE